MKMGWSPDGTMLAIAYADGPTIVWEVATNTQISTISSGDDGSERSISWSPDNQTIALAAGNGTVSVWNANTGELMYSTKPLTGVVAALSPDGKRIAFAWEYGETQIADITQLPDITPALTITLTPTPNNEFPDGTDEPR
jgi:WD40 repeat protein